MKGSSGLKSWLSANPFPLGTFLGAALILSPMLALPLLGETAGISQPQQMDVTAIREGLQSDYTKIKQQIFAEHGVALNPDGEPNKNAPGYKKAVKKIEPHHENMLKKAKVFNKAREDINKKIFDEAGVKNPTTDPKLRAGSNPGGKKGRGILGDAEGKAATPQEYDKIVKTLEKNKIPFEKQGDYIRIKGSDTVIHRPASKFGDKVGGSGHQAKVSAQTSGPETAGSASGQKKYQKVGSDGQPISSEGTTSAGKGGEVAAKKDGKGAALDSAKKMQDALNNKPETPWQKAARDQVIAKEANRINEAAGRPEDPLLKRVKEGADPDLIKGLKKPVKETALKQTKESWKKIETTHSENMTKLDQDIKNAKTPAEARNLKAQKIDMVSRHEGTMETIIKKDGGKALAEVKGQPPSAQETGKSTVSKPDSTAGTKGTKGMAGVEEGTASAGKGAGESQGPKEPTKPSITKTSGRAETVGAKGGSAAGEGTPVGERTGGGKTVSEPPLSKLGITELPAGAGAARTALNKAGGATLKVAGIIGLIYAGHEIANNTAEALGALDGGDKQKAVEKGKAAAVDVAVVGVPLVIAAASPAAGVVLGGAGVGVGGYVVTRTILENTKVGQAIDKGVEGSMLTGYEKGKATKEKVDDKIRSMLGRETNAEKAEKKKQEDVDRQVSRGLSETKAKEFMEAKEKHDRGEITSDKFKQISKDIRKSKESDKISGLKNSETQTDQKDRSTSKDPEGEKAGRDLAKNTNLTDSYQKDRSDKSSKETQQTQTAAGSTLSEKNVASHARNLIEQSKNTAQGKLTETAISQTRQESTQAQKTDQLEKNTAIGTILAGSLLGGLTSGVAIGLDNAFGTIGRGAGEQASISTGIKPKPEPAPPLTSTDPKYSGSSSTPNTPSPQGSALPTTASVQGKPTSTQGSKLDCSAYRSSTNALNASIMRGSMSMSDYRSQYAVLMSKYKGCTGAAAAAGVAITPPITVSTPPKTSVPPVAPVETKPTAPKGSTEVSECVEWQYSKNGERFCVKRRASYY
jgi:hypothetical protein